MRIDDAAARRWPEELRKATTRMRIWGDGHQARRHQLSTVQPTGVSMERRKQPLYSEDASFISGLEQGLTKGNAAKRAVKNTVGFSSQLWRPALQ
ncbi:hypothetical protein BSN85_18110 [Bradyrhizobium brasilense]|uniref:hypothetical protein n=1 Tax=Bradyrhizobium brasilense TaxID=1419277 RepID=UPI00097A76E5|nr:hypothetical protein [Bradyrhizobium brasilense]OMI08486.1 hypothetical protein BSN85_18110 [Bradyrhizobium brasilense]